LEIIIRDGHKNRWIIHFGVFKGSSSQWKMVETNEILGEGLNTSPLVFTTCFGNNLLNLYNKMGLFLLEGVKCRFIQIAGHYLP